MSVNFDDFDLTAVDETKEWEFDLMRDSILDGLETDPRRAPDLGGLDGDSNSMAAPPEVVPRLSESRGGDFETLDFWLPSDLGIGEREDLAARVP